MSIYIPKIKKLPQDQMSQLAPDARFSMVNSGRPEMDYVYEWNDMKITITVMPKAEMTPHLEAFVGWARNVAQAQGRKLDEALVKRIRSTTLVLGIMCEGTADRTVWDERVQDIVSIICFNTGALLFWEGFIYDENCTQLLP